MTDPVDPFPAPEADPVSWAPLDLGPILRGEVTSPAPTLLARDDGVCLLYRGYTHSIHGESESGKSMVCQIEAARLLAAGERVAYIDFEDTAVSVVGRLLLFGASVEDIADRFAYIQPDMRPDMRVEEGWALDALIASQPALVVIDGVTEALGIYGYGSNDNDEITKWGRALPKRIARESGAAVVMVDHVAKGDARSRFAIGGQAKLAMVTGAAYVADIVDPLAVGLRGVVRLSVGKDRHGRVRAHAGSMDGPTRLSEVARVVIDSTDGDDAPPVVTIETPAREVEGGAWRPTVLMERVAEYVEASTDGLTKPAIRKGVAGSDDAFRTALAALTDEGYLTTTAGPRNSIVYHSARHYG